MHGQSKTAPGAEIWDRPSLPDPGWEPRKIGHSLIKLKVS
jgi:hypothetical protein